MIRDGGVGAGLHFLISDIIGRYEYCSRLHW